MNGMRSTGSVVSLALLASLVGHFAIHQYFDRRSHVRYGNAGRAPQIADLFSSQDLPESVVPGDLRNLSAPRFDRQIVHANDGGHAETAPRENQHGKPPVAVPAPTDSLPVETSKDGATETDDNSAAVRDVIEWELSTATREEREIWFEELKSLPAGVVSDLLQVRKKLNALPKLMGGMPERLASADTAVFPKTQEINAAPASQKIRFNASDLHLAAEALETAVTQLRHNLVNAATPGFKRLRVTLIDVYSAGRSELDDVEKLGRDGIGESTIAGEGCRVGPILIDMKPGFLKKTGRELDLAIDGSGFFVVRRGEQQYLTRSGALRLDRDRQLCLSVFSDSAVLQPAIKIPDDAIEIQITPEGDVTTRNAEAAPFVPLGRLQLAQVANPSSLDPCGNLVYAANHDSGDIVPGEPCVNGRGRLRQGFLEQSNVDVEQEVAEIEELSSILKAIPQQATRPATARSLNQTPTR